MPPIRSGPASGGRTRKAVAALSFLAGQPQVDWARLAVFGHSEGGIYALLLASGLAGPAPKVRTVVLLEPVPVRFLGLVEQSTIASDAVAIQQGGMKRPPRRGARSRRSPGWSLRCAAPARCRPECRPGWG